MTQIKNLMGDVKEGLGKAIVTSLSPAFQWLLDRLGEVQTKINDMNASRDLRNDLENGVDIGLKYSPEILQSELERLANQNNFSESRLRSSYIAQINSTKPVWAKDKLTMDDSGGFSQTGDAFWDFDPVMKSMYQEYKRNQDLMKRLGQGIIIANNKPAATVPDFVGLDEADGSVSGSGEKTLSLYEQILEITKATEAAQRRILENRIEENEIIREHLPLQVSANKMTQEESEFARILLDQQIKLDRASLKNLDKKPDLDDPPTAGDFISKNVSLSASAQAAAIDANIAKAEGYLAAAEAGSAEEEQLKEIIAALREQKDLLGAVESRSAEAAKSMVSGWAKAVDSIYSLVGQVYENQINQLESALDRQREAWDSYYADIQDKYKKDRDALDAQYQWGRISAEEYYSSLTALSDAKARAEEENASAEEELMERIDELKERQFNADKANSIIQATVAGALSIANIWKEWGKQPIMAGILTGLSAAAVGAQIATIASQQYTPMAEGGVATGPTHALIGEGGEPELVLPLSKANEFGFGGSGGVINIIVNIGNGMYSRDEWVKIVFDAIERAQRTGALPRWRYAA
jgi:hypothetical protein